MNALTDNQISFLYYLQMGLFGDSNIEKPKNVDWSWLYKESCLQAVAGIIFEGINQAHDKENLPQEISAKWFQQTCKIMVTNQQLLNEQNKVIAVLEKADIPCVILKGTSAAAAYPVADIRSSGDIDLLVDKERFDTAVEVLKENGYKTPGVFGGHHLQFFKNGVEIELHLCLGGLPTGKAGERIKAYYKDAVQEKQSIELNGYTIPVLNEKMQGCCLLLHIIQHLQNAGIGFRQICDYACFRNQYADIISFEEMVDVYEKFGILDAYKIVENLCYKYMNVKNCKAVKKLDGVSAEVLKAVFDYGNFGNKKAELVKSKYLVRRYDTKNRDSKNNKMKALYNASLTMSPVFEKYKVLRPFAMIAFLTRYTWRLITGRRNLKTTVNLYKEANKREQVLSQLHLFEVEN